MIVKEDHERRCCLQYENNEQKSENERLFRFAMEKGILSVDRSGFIVLDSSKAKGELLAYAESINKMVPAWNLSIHWGFLVWDEENDRFFSPEMTEDYMAERVYLILTENQDNNPFLLTLQHEQETEKP